ncbi:MAG: hypothetical protein EBR82_30105 [Caulobacteraceae bacterium]|nr:hypothetical protein [Caulobacteraceae bacterium]
MRLRLGQLRRLIRESLEVSSLAAFRPHSGPGSARIVVYDVDLILRAGAAWEMEGPAAFGRLLRGGARGYIWIRDPNQMSEKHGPCRGAWEVVTSYFPGGGDLLYKLAFAIAPNGLLVSDRKEVSPRAGERWRKISKTHSGLPLDDKTHPPGHENHTEDPGDDCVCWAEDGMEHLNVAYAADGTEATLLKTLEDRHAAVMRDAALAELAPDMEELLFQAVSQKFADLML